MSHLLVQRRFVGVRCTLAPNQSRPTLHPRLRSTARYLALGRGEPHFMNEGTQGRRQFDAAIGNSVLHYSVD